MIEMTPEEVGRLTGPQREARVLDLMAHSESLVLESIKQHVAADNKNLAAVATLFSGGNDSTVLAHLFRDVATHAIHANTTIGIEQTRQFVRDTCASWDLPLIEVKPPNEKDHYRTLVLDQGFPGPGHHYKMFQRLKERGLRQARRELVRSRDDRVVFLAGRRRHESARRANIPEMERVGSTVWCSPLVDWTALDMNTYRLMQGDVPVNEVSALIHMSGECLCGAFAHEGELAEIAEWFPEVAAEIHALEAEIAHREDIKPHARTWGWGGDPETLKASRSRAKSGPMCSSCDARTAHDHTP